MDLQEAVGKTISGIYPPEDGDDSLVIRFTDDTQILVTGHLRGELASLEVELVKAVYHG